MTLGDLGTSDHVRQVAVTHYLLLTYSLDICLPLLRAGPCNRYTGPMCGSHRVNTTGGPSLKLLGVQALLTAGCLILGEEPACARQAITSPWPLPGCWQDHPPRVTAKNVCRHCQTPAGKRVGNSPWVRTTGPGGTQVRWRAAGETGQVDESVTEQGLGFSAWKK